MLNFRRKIIHRELKGSGTTTELDLERYSVDQEDLFITLSIIGVSRKIELTKVRMALFFINLVVLAAAFVSYFAWMDAKYNWQVENVGRPNRNILKAMESLQALPDGVEVTITGVHCYLDQMLYFTSFNLFFYWVIYGVIISCRFGGTCDICTIVVTLPHTVMMIVWEVGVSVAVIRVIFILTSLDWASIKFNSLKHFQDLKYVQEFYESWGPWIAGSYLSSVPSQLILAALPFFVTDIPFQNDSYGIDGRVSTVPPKQLENSGVGHNNCLNKTNTTKKTQADKSCQPRWDWLCIYLGNKLGLLASFVSERRKSLCESIERVEMRRASMQIHPVDNENSENRFVDDSEYVTLDNIHMTAANSEVPTLYQCEMPHEKLQSQKLFSRVRRVSWQGMSAGKAVLDTMNRVYHVHNSSRPLWSLLDGIRTPDPRLQAVDTLSGGVSIYSAAAESLATDVSFYSADNDYIEMSPPSSLRTNTPPPYRLYDPTASNPDHSDSVFV